jgi:hypothetical protein
MNLMAKTRYEPACHHFDKLVSPFLVVAVPLLHANIERGHNVSSQTGQDSEDATFNVINYPQSLVCSTK